MEWKDYFNLLVLIHLILQLFFGLFIFYKAQRILRLKQIFTKATPTMLLYFCFITILSLSLAIYSLFCIVFWRPDIILADQTALYIIGFIPWILICINPICEFCLCLERIFTISFPYRYLDKSKKVMCAFTFLFSLICLLFITFMNEFVTKIPQFSPPRCRFFTCFTVYMPKPYLLPFKIAVSIFEGFAAVFLLFLIKYKTSNSNGKFRNTAMVIIISTTIFCEFTPNLIDFILDLFFDNITLVTYIGPYRTTISCISITINILMYSKVFNRNKGVKATVHVTPSSSFPKRLINNFIKN